MTDVLAGLLLGVTLWSAARLWRAPRHHPFRGRCGNHLTRNHMNRLVCQVCNWSPHLADGLDWAPAWLANSRGPGAGPTGKPLVNTLANHLANDPKPRVHPPDGGCDICSRRYGIAVCHIDPA